jgi:hypothetical protein
MKLLFFTALVFSASLGLNAQRAWTVTHGTNTKFSATSENEIKNKISISKSSLNKPGNLTISYRNTDEKGWKRQMMITDTAGNHISSPWDSISMTGKAGTSVFRMPNTMLKKLLTQYSKIKIHTIALPTDPELAAVIRVRSIHVITVILK